MRNDRSDDELKRGAPFDPSRAWRDVVLALCFVGGYLLLDWISYIHPMPGFHVTPWNPQPALAIALLMSRGLLWLPMVYVAIFLSEYVVRGAASWPFVAALVAVMLGTCYWGMARALRGKDRIEANPAMTRLVIVVAVGALLSGLMYVSALVVSARAEIIQAPEALMRFWIGDGVGILVTLPLVWIAADPKKRSQLKAVLRKPEVLAQLLTVALALWFVLGRAPTEQFKYFYVLFLPLIWIATRHGMTGAAFAAGVIQGGVIVAVQLGSFQPATVFELQALLFALTVTGYFLGVSVDEGRRVAKELAHSLRLASAGEMAAALAHELNQPLTAAATYAKAGQILASGGAQDVERLQETLRKLDDEVRRAADVVRHLRDFFRAGTIRRETVAMDALLARVTESLSPRIQSQQIQLRVDIDPTVTELIADRLQIEVVMRNLLANACDAVMMAPLERRAIDIVVEPTARRAVRVSVIDGGSGVATAEDAVRLLEPFVTEKSTGMGVGLSISKAIVQAHGGELWIEPGAVGIVRFSLPDGKHGNQ